MNRFIKLALFLFGFVSLSFGQNQQRLSLAISNAAGYAELIPNAQVTLCVYNSQLQCNTPVGIYQDQALTELIGYPFYADANGNYSYFTYAGTYVEQVCSPLNQCYTLPVTLIKGGGGGGSGTVTSVSCGNLNPLYNCAVTNSTTNAAISFTQQTAPNFTFYGNISGSATAPIFVNFVAGSNITLTPSGGNTLTISASGGGSSSCGPLSTDSTSTDCGNGNFTGATSTEQSEIFGYTNGDAVQALDQYILTGVSNYVPSTTAPIGPGPVIAYGLNNFTFGTTTLSDFGDNYAFGNDNITLNNGSFSANTNIVIGFQNMCSSNPGTSSIDDNYVIGETNLCYTAIGGHVSVSNTVLIGDTNLNATIGTGTATWSDLTGGGDQSIQLGLDNGTDTSHDIVTWGDGSLIGDNIHDADVGGHQAVVFLENSNDVVAHGHELVSDLVTSHDLDLGGHNLLYPTSGDLSIDQSNFSFIVAHGYNILTGTSDTNLSGIVAIGSNLMNGASLSGLTNIICIGQNSPCSTSNQTVVGDSSTTSLVLFGCPSGQTVYDDGSGTCYVPGSGGSGGTNVSVNGGSTLGSANFNNTTPAAGSSFINTSFQVSGSNVSSEVPYATSSAFGVVKPDNTSITISGGVISAVASSFPTSQAYVGTNGSGNIIGVSTSDRITNAVLDYGADNTGATETSTAIANCINNLPASGGTCYLPKGTYLDNNGVLISATSTTKKGIRFVGESMNGTIIESNCSNGYAFWWDNTTSNAGNQYGPDIENLTVDDTSGTGACSSLIRITQFNNDSMHRVNFLSSGGKQYTTGTATLTNGSTAVTGSGTTWTSAMVPGLIWINGYPAEVTTFNSATSLTLTTPWQQPTASTSAYSLDWNGNCLWLEGTSADGFAQYGSFTELYGTGCRIGVYGEGGPTSSQGISRFKFIGGFFNAARVVDSLGFFFGQYGDTEEWNIPVNNSAFYGVLESTHLNKIEGEYENDSPFAVVTTCNGGVAAQSCTKGVYVDGDTTAHTFNNAIIGTSMNNVGNGIEWTANVYGLTIANNRLHASVLTNVFASPSTSSTGYTTASILDNNLTLIPSTSNLILSSITGSTQCLEILSTGQIAGTGSACPGSASSVTVNGSSTLPTANFVNNSGAGEIDFTNPSGSTVNATLHNTSITVNGTTCTLGSTCAPTADNPNALTMNNSGTGAPSGTAYNGSATETISYNTIGAAPLASPTFTGTVTIPALDLSGITGSTQCLQVNSSGTVSGTGAACGGGGSTAWSSLTNPTTNLSLSMGSDTSTFTFGATTGSSDLFKWTDTISNTGTGILGHFTTASGSTETPWQADADGIGWKVTDTGTFTNVGSSQAGTIDLGAGSAPSAAPTSTVQIFVPSSITAYGLEMPGAQPTANNQTISCTDANPSVCSFAGLGLSTPTGTPSFTAGTNVTSATCTSGYTCTNTRGEITIVGGTATTGTIATVNFSSTLSAAPFCSVSLNGNGGSATTFYDLGHGAPSTSSFTITAGISIVGATLNVDYTCQL